MDSNRNNGFYYWPVPMGGAPPCPNQYAPNWPIPILVPPPQPYYNADPPQPYTEAYQGPTPQPTLYQGQAVPEGTFLVHNPSPYNYNGNPVYLPVAPPPPPPPQVAMARPVPVDAPREPYFVPGPPTMPQPPQPQRVSEPVAGPSSQAPPNPFPFGAINITVPVYSGRDDLPPKYLTISVPLADPTTIPQPPEYPSYASSSGSDRSHALISPLELSGNWREGEGNVRDRGELGQVEPDPQENHNVGGLAQAGYAKEQNDGGQGQVEQIWGGGPQPGAVEGPSGQAETVGQDGQGAVAGQQNAQGSNETAAGSPQQQGARKKRPKYSGRQQHPPQSLLSLPSLLCKFCQSNGETRAFSHGHNTYDENGKTICPVLRRLVCKICGATGDHAHTLKYCPQQGERQRQSYLERDSHADGRSSAGGYLRVKY